MLPEQYEPLLLTFHDPEIVNGNVVIGSDYGTELRMVDSAIISVDPTATLPDRFMNSSLDQLAACLETHDKFTRTVDAAGNEKAELLAVDAFVLAIGQIDPVCISDPENWWAFVIEQIQTGNL